MAELGRDDADVIGRLLMRVYEIHERVIARGGGGLEGIRDAAMLHAAVARPFATFGEAEFYPTDFDKAAALFHSLIKSHPFLDGTKRTAFAVAVYFLHERGYTLQRPFLKDEIIRFCVGLAEEGQRRAEGEPAAVQTIRQIQVRIGFYGKTRSKSAPGIHLLHTAARRRLRSDHFPHRRP